MENKKVKIILFIILVLIIISIVTLIGRYNEEIAEKAKEIQEMITQSSFKTTEGIDIVPTMQDEISSDTVWCCTFQLVWNDLKDEIAKKDIVFNEQVVEAENLNKSEFNSNMISDDYYYKKYGIMNSELKKEIEDGIKEKFGETSNILNDFDWSSEDSDKYFLYAMLKRKFEFYYEFDDLEKSNFGKNYKNVSYFGIDEKTKNEVRSQVEVIYYNSKDDFAIQINTKQNDEVIICKGNEGKTFKEIYDKVKNTTYDGSISLSNTESLKIPNLEFKEKKEFTNLQDKEFTFSTGEIYTIEEAIQTVEFKLDKKGGEVKSEAGMGVAKMALPTNQEENREFYVDDTFTLFLRENGRELPYFAARINDITKFQ